MPVPWFKFYPAAWRADPALRSCSIGARGLWMEMLCIMHEATPRGWLLIGNSTPTLHQLASISAVPLKSCRSFMEELERAGVFSHDGEKIFSRRMLRDTAQAERDKANGALGGNPVVKGGVNPPVKAKNIDSRRKEERIPEGGISESVTRARPASRDNFFEKEKINGHSQPPLSEFDWQSKDGLVIIRENEIAEMKTAYRYIDVRAQIRNAGRWALEKQGIADPRERRSAMELFISNRNEEGRIRQEREDRREAERTEKAKREAAEAKKPKLVRPAW